jgi:hypothetical protein
MPTAQNPCRGYNVNPPNDFMLSAAKDAGIEM